MNELIPFKQTLQSCVRTSLTVFERRGYFPRPVCLPDASVPYAAMLLTVHLAELLLRVLVSVAFGVIIWMLIGSRFPGFQWFLFFLMGCGHVVDAGRSLTYFPLQPNPTSPPAGPRTQPVTSASGTNPVAAAEETVGEVIPEDKPGDDEAVALGPDDDSSSQYFESGPLAAGSGQEPLGTGLAEPDSAWAQTPESLPTDSRTETNPGMTGQPPRVVEFTSFSEAEPIDTVESLNERAVVISNPRLAATPREGPHQEIHDLPLTQFVTNRNSHEHCNQGA